jgi:tetratricopeptide (TPR) repeat protein
MGAAVLVALAVACSPLTSGYYSLTAWAPLTIGATVLLVVLALVIRPRLTRAGAVASLGLMLLAALSFGSLLWAESHDSAWTSANQAALYATIFAIGVLAIRRRRSAHVVLLILGMPGLLTSVVLALILATGGGGNAYLLGRLDQPIGYVNATAGLLAMGIWPWLALAEATRKPRVRVAAMTGAAMIAAIAVTTQARALIPAFLVTIALVLVAAPGRTRRALHLAIVVTAILTSEHWTLSIYSSTGPTQSYMPPASVLRGAGIAVICSSLIAAGLTLALARLGARLPEHKRAQLSRWTGRVMLAAVASAVIAIGVGAQGTVVTQWNDFTHLNPEQSAPNRFIAIGSGFRFDLWRVALDEFETDPIIGVGAGNYDDSYYRLRHNPQSVTVPHSLEMQMLAELGAAGFLALLLFCAAVLRAGIAVDRRTLAGTDPAIRIAALGVFAAWLTETSFDWLYNIPGLTGMAMLAAAILVARAPEAGQIAGYGSKPRRQLAVIAAVGVLALLAASLGRQYAATLYGDSGEALVARHPLDALRELRAAEQLDPWSMPTQYAVAAAYARLDDYAAARIVLVHAEQLEPENYVPPALLGDIATRAGDPVAALAAYRRALRLDPLEPTLKQALDRARAAAG